MSMESARKQEVVKAKIGVESPETSESISEAKELYAQLLEFNNTEIVGSEALARVEAIAYELGIKLQGISEKMCLREGLPYHPMDTKLV